MIRLTWLTALVVFVSSCSDANPGHQAADINASPVDSGQVDTSTPLPTDCGGQADGTSCDDGDPCTIDDECQAEACIGGSNNPCTSESGCETGTCVPGKGCEYTAVEDGTECAVACFGAAACMGGKCLVDPETQVVCPPPSAEKPCVSELQCDPNSGSCTLEILAPAESTCDSDSNLCTYETCTEAGECKATGTTNKCELEMLDAPCEQWQCSKKTGDCKSSGFAGAISCNDGNPCTVNDTCTQDDFGFTACAGAPVPVDDSNPCTDDACVDGEVVHKPVDGVPCTPGDSCSNTGLCQAGACLGDAPCECEEDSDCDASANLCVGEMYCDKTGDQPACKAVQGTVTICPASAEPCLVNTCNPDTGQCAEVAAPEGADCDDSDPCTQGDHCHKNTCVPSAFKNCDDGQFCNGKESCEPMIGCVAGVPPAIDDGVPCTVDNCNDDTDLVEHIPNDSACSDDDDDNNKYKEDNSGGGRGTAPRRE